jgi:CheY-like chemotaxis protein
VHRVTAVTSGPAALAHLQAGARFDVILCDMTMPGMSGMALHERLLAMAPDQAARMVFLSGGALTPAARVFLERHPVLEKPFELRALEAVVAARVAPEQGIE